MEPPTPDPGTSHHHFSASSSPQLHGQSKHILPPHLLGIWHCHKQPLQALFDKSILPKVLGPDCGFEAGGGADADSLTQRVVLAKLCLRQHINAAYSTATEVKQSSR